MDFHGKVAIVTGSSSGIGQCVVLMLAKLGAKVTIHGMSDERINNTLKLLHDSGVKDDHILVVKGPIQEDATRKQIIDKTVEKFGQLDVLVNNAGVSHSAKFDQFDEEQFRYVMDVNVNSAFSMSRHALPYLKKTHGNIVNVSSISGQRPAPFWQFYRLSKAALDHATRIQAYDFSRYGVRVNAVSPGVVETNFVARNTSTEVSDQVFRNYSKNIPLGRLAGIDEIANVIVFAGSGLASYMTGAVVVVDGGMVLGPPLPENVENGST